MDQKISSHQLKRFVRHLSVVTKHYYEREKAKKSFDSHLNKMKKSTDIDKDISLLNKKINILLEKESRVAELGIDKKLPPSAKKKIALLQEQLVITQTERDAAVTENESLKKSVESLSDLKEAMNHIDETKEKTEKRVGEIESKVDNKYREHILNELKEKISLLESNYKQISKDNSINPARLYRVEEKIKSYKEKLRKIRAS